jgi:hypothetical protein
MDNVTVYRGLELAQTHLITRDLRVGEHQRATNDRGAAPLAGVSRGGRARV